MAPRPSTTYATAFKFGHEHVAVACRLGGTIQDERGHKFATGCKGSGGIKPCGICSNFYNFRFKRFPDPAGFAVSSGSPYFSVAKQYTDAQLRSLYKRFMALTEADDPKLKRLSEEFGYNYEPTAFLLTNT